MITKFENYKLITEDPDTPKGYDNRYHDDDAVAFFCTVTEDKTKVNRLYYRYSVTHWDINGNYNRGELSTLNTYPGRLWINSKLITFWTYPNTNLFVDILKHLEKELNIKIFNNNWNIEIVVDESGYIKGKDDDDNVYFGNDRDEYKDSHGNELKEKIIPIEDYIGSIDQPEEKHIWHLMNAQQKAEAKLKGDAPDFKGWGSDMTAWDGPNPLWWRQAKYQENKNF